VKVRFAGSGDAFGSGGRLQTCIYVEAESVRFLIDCGATALSGLKRLGIDPAAIDVIVLSHLHGDHFGGVPFFIIDGQFRRGSRSLTIVGPSGTAARCYAAMDLMFPGSAGVERRFQTTFIEVTPRMPAPVGALVVTGYEMTHPSGAPTLALRVECGGRVLAYSADTEWTDTLLEVAGGADVFVCEAYYFEKRIRYHLDYRTVEAHRASLNCRRLVLTHMSDDMLGRAQEVQIRGAEMPVVVAEDGLTLTI
jgi:ribonuclease BN (tRNA processing enzyme)